MNCCIFLTGENNYIIHFFLSFVILIYYYIIIIYSFYLFIKYIHKYRDIENISLTIICSIKIQILIIIFKNLKYIQVNHHSFIVQCKYFVCLNDGLIILDILYMTTRVEKLEYVFSVFFFIVA